MARPTPLSIESSQRLDTVEFPKMAGEKAKTPKPTPAAKMTAPIRCRVSPFLMRPKPSPTPEWVISDSTTNLCPSRQGQVEVRMPTGKVKWYKVEQGFGFIADDNGEDVFVHASALPEGVASLRPGQRVEFGIVDGKRGPQALSIRILDPLPSVVRGTRKGAEALAIQIEDVIVLLDKVGKDLKAGRFPQDAQAKKIAQILRATADDLDV